MVGMGEREIGVNSMEGLECCFFGLGTLIL